MRRLDVLTAIGLGEQVDASRLGLALGCVARVLLLATPTGSQLWIEFNPGAQLIALLDHRATHRYSSFAWVHRLQQLLVGQALETVDGIPTTTADRAPATAAKAAKGSLSKLRSERPRSPITMDPWNDRVWKS